MTQDHEPSPGNGVDDGDLDGLVRAAFGAEHHTGDPKVRAVEPEPDGAGRYEAGEEIGRGGIGVVYRALDSRLGRELAMKVLQPRHLGNPRIVGRFLEEAQIGGQLQHPGIVPVYDMGTAAEELPFFTMKLVSGETLAEQLANRGSTEEERQQFLSIFAQICQAVSYAHSRGVIHRDLKPSNVMIGAFGEVQVMDWGLAKVRARVESERSDPTPSAAGSDVRPVHTDASGQRTESGSVTGTPAYMAPEQARGDVDKVDERADVFALGGILCEILTGGPPFEGGDSRALRRAAAAGELEPAFERLARSGAEDELADIARACLAPSAADRPHDAGVVAERTRAYLASVERRLRESELTAEAARARAAEALARATAERRARRLSVSLVSTVGVALLGALVVYGIMAERRRDRLAETGRVVDQAIEQATLLRGEARAAAEFDPEKWARAVSAARRAHEVAIAGEHDTEMLERADALFRAIESEDIAAREVADRRSKDVAMSARLDGIPEELSVRVSLPWAAQAYDAAFREYGIDLASLPGEAAAEKIRASAVCEDLVAGLSSWAALDGLGSAVSRTPDEEEQLKSMLEDLPRIRELLELVDPDSEMAHLRRAVSERKGILQALESLDLSQTAPRSLNSVLTGVMGPTTLKIRRRMYAIHPGDFWINFSLGIHLSKLGGKLEVESISYLRAAAALRPNSPSAWTALAEVFKATGRLDDSVAACQRVAEGHPELPDVHYNLSLAYNQAGEYRKALTALDRFLELQPGDVEALTRRLYMLFFRLREFDRGIDMLPGLLDIESTQAWDYSRVARPLDAVGDVDGAIDMYRKAIETDPNQPEGHCFLGLLLESRGELGEALELLERGHELGTRTGQWGYSSQAWIRGCERFLEMAAQLEDREFDPMATEAPHQYGSALLRLGRYAEAVDLFAAGFESNPVAKRFKMDAAQAAVLAATDARDRRDFLQLGLTWTTQALDGLEPDTDHNDEYFMFVVGLEYRPEWEVLRDPACLALLGEESRTDWEALWTDVDALLQGMRVE